MKAKLYKFLTMFDCEGFECLIDITKREKDWLITTLKGEEYQDDLSLNAMMLRARYNPQRSPEIWIFTSTVDDATLQEIKDENPQELVDLIREHGHNLWITESQKQVIK